MTVTDMKNLDEGNTVQSLRADKNLICRVDSIDEYGVVISCNNEEWNDRFLWEESYLLEHYEIKPHMLGDEF